MKYLVWFAMFWLMACYYASRLTEIAHLLQRISKQLEAAAALSESNRPDGKSQGGAA